MKPSIENLPNIATGRPKYQRAGPGRILVTVDLQPVAEIRRHTGYEGQIPPWTWHWHDPSQDDITAPSLKRLKAQAEPLIPKTQQGDPQ